MPCPMPSPSGPEPESEPDRSTHVLKAESKIHEMSYMEADLNLFQ